MTEVIEDKQRKLSIMKNINSNNRVKLIFIISLVISFQASCFGTFHVKKHQETNHDPESVARGEVIYLKNCARCHGEDGSGNGSDADNLPTKPQNLSEKGLHITNYGLENLIDYPHYSTETISKTIRHGNDIMEPEEIELSSTEITDLVNYLKFKIFSN